MDAVLLIDFGSTNTKISAVDIEGECIIGAATAFTSVDTDIGEGLAEALETLRKKTGPLTIRRRFACSSAAGGLRMIAAGLVPALTAEAARLATLGAGARVIRVFSYGLTDEDIAETAALKPDIFLLAGGTDGGNRDCLLHNAARLAACPADFPVIIAGNRNVQKECADMFKNREVIRCPNVMPRLNEINIEPVQEEIRRIFLERIIHAKGLSRERELISGILMPTPAAVKQALELLSGGTKKQAGLGELMAADLGGATTDVYSLAGGLPAGSDTVLKGISEPFSKRTVEGDIGMRYSARGVWEAMGAERLAGISGCTAAELDAWVELLGVHPEKMPETAGEEAMDFALAAGALETAFIRHAGTLEEVYLPSGPVYMQSGKDLTRVSHLVLTGGALIHSKRIEELARFTRFEKSRPFSLRPEKTDVYVDASYIIAAAGLLAETWPEVSFSIIKKEMTHYGTAE
ncbi:MAG: glutamate mutase L [Treponema sp.]|jgi:uncharacterized protein (TIGR01319 family)|nr:glutamate mutase L [Treponema sp.]